MPEESTNISLLNACAIAVSGMIGGGIFAVLGEAITISGNATFISLGISGVLALITGVVYSKLTVEYDEPGGSFIFIEHITGPNFAGTVSWFLLLGYIFTISLYAYAFGAYADRLLNLGIGPNFLLSSCIVIFMMILNLSSIRKSGSKQSLFFYLKIAILTGLITLGFYSVHPSHIFPVDNKGATNIFLSAALVFVAYEGFQLLTYDYDRLDHHKKNLPKAVWISISMAIVIYMLIAFVLTGSLSPGIIEQQKETAIALLAQPRAGQLGMSVILASVVYSTASAIHITEFEMTRLAKRISDDGQLPHQLTDSQSGGIPIVFALFVVAATIFILYIYNLAELTTLCSLSFLFVFSIVNFLGYIHEIFKGWKQVLPLLGSTGCAGGFSILLYNTYQNHLRVVYQLMGISLFLILARVLYTSFHSRYKGRSA